MKKTILLFGIASWALVAILFIGVLVKGFSERGKQLEQGDTLLKEESVSIDDLSNMIVKSPSVGIEVVSTSQSEMKVSQYGNSRTREEDLFYTERNGDTVSIRIKPRIRIFQINFGFYKEKLVVQVPESWLGNVELSCSSGSVRLKDAFTWKDADFHCSSGGIIIENPLQTENLKLSVSSGGIHANADLTVNDKLDVNSTSGGIHFNYPVKANEIQGKVSSGGMHLGEVNVRTFDLKSTSGGITIEGITGEGDMKVSSGGINIRLVEPKGNINLKSTSGKIKIGLDSSLAFQFEGKCTSGSIRSDFPLDRNEKGNRASAVIGNDPQAIITAEASSGGIQLIQN